MSTDWVEKEREFLSSLEADTGRDLAEWMAAIRAQDLPHRNDIIDWLRQQGFPFARASWLERIHNNGGRPIYLEPDWKERTTASRTVPQAPPARVATPAKPIAAAATPPPPADTQPDRARASSAPALTLAPAQAPAGAPSPPAAAVPPAAGATGAMEALLAKAKAYRPLAQYVLREIQIVLPEVEIAPRHGYVSIAAGHEFAVLAISSKELRLGLTLGEEVLAPGLEPARFPPTMAQAAQRMSHMVVLTDARQVDDRLLALVKAARQRAGA